MNHSVEFYIAIALREKMRHLAASL